MYDVWVTFLWVVAGCKLFGLAFFASTQELRRRRRRGKEA